MSRAPGRHSPSSETGMRPHRWKFIRSAGVDQVVIRSGADVVNVEHLDQKLWVALACPTRGLDIDPRTLDLIDSDNDGRIRAPELIEATRWVRDLPGRPMTGSHVSATSSGAPASTNCRSSSTCCWAI